MTINATAAMLLLLYQLVAEEQGVPGDALRGTIQNDILKEYVARGTYIYPPRPSMRLITDIFAYCAERAAAAGTRSRSPATTSARPARPRSRRSPSPSPTASPTWRPRSTAGLDVDEFAPRLSFFFNAHNDLFEEVAKFRAARRLWARIMSERFGAQDPRSTMLRFHTQTGGSTLTAQQPENNVVRVTIQALAAVLGGTQSLHTNGFDEALGLPTERAAKLALRTQQVIAYESGVADTVDPLGGSYFVEALTDEVERARARLPRRRSTSAAARSRPSRRGYLQGEIEAAAYDAARARRARRAGRRRREPVRRRRRPSSPTSSRSTRLSSGAQVERVARAQARAATRDAVAPRRSGDVAAAARGTQNLLVPDAGGLGARARRSARSPTCCAPSSASTARASARAAR